MNDDRGELLYDEPTREIRRKEKFQLFGLTILTFSIGGSLIILIIYGPKENLGPFYIATIIFLTWGAGAFIGAFSISDLQIYKNGIVLPQKTFIQILKREEKYIEFNKIKVLYPNENTPKWFLTLLKVDGRVLYISKEDLDYMDIVLEFIEGMGVDIIWDEDWSPTEQ